MELASDKMQSLLRRALVYSRVPFGIIALAGLVLSGFVHAASIRGADIESAWPRVWALHYALFPIIVLAVLTAGAVAGQRRLGLRAFLALVPTPALVLLAAALVYALATFLIFMPLSRAGAPVIKDGRFFLNNHGVIREVSEDQFHFERSVTLRLFSSVWLYLYLFAVVYLLGARRPRNESPRKAPRS
jgi:hypothetical protein